MTTIIVFILLTIALIAFLASATMAARSIRGRLRVAGTIVNAATERSTAARRRHNLQAELQHLAAGLAQPEAAASGRVPAAVVDQATLAADTRALPDVTSHQPRHAAVEREHVLDELAAGGWTRDRLQANATPESRW